MNHDLNQSSTPLARGALQRIEDGRGVWVQCLSGSLWLTQEHDRRDFILEAGDEVLIERPGTSVLYGLRDSGFVLLRPGEQPSAARKGAEMPVTSY